MPKLNSSQYFSLLRILFGLWLTLHFINIFPYASEIYSLEGVKVLGAELYLKTTFALLRSPMGIKCIVTLAIFSSILFTLKYYRFVNSIILFIIWIFLFHQNLLTYNPGVPYVGWFLLVFIVSPTNECRFFWKKPVDNFVFPPILFWGIWILMSMTLATSGIHKWFFSPLWKEGLAVKYILNYPATRFSFLINFYLKLPLIFQKIFTWLLLVMESSIVIGFIFSRWRKITWFLSFLLHLGILITLKFAELSLVMMLFHLFLVEEKWGIIGGLRDLQFLKKNIE